MELDNNHGKCLRVGVRAFASTLLLLCVIAIRGRGQTAAPSGLTPLTLELAIATALRANADLLTARLRVDSARAERRIASAWPNPTFSATPSNPSQYALQIPLDIWPARRFRETTTAQGVSAAHFDVANTQRQVVFAVRQAFYDVLLADSLRTLANDQAETFRRLLAADSVRLRNGSIAERDVVTTRLRLAHAMAVVARSAVQQHATRLALEMLVGATTPDTSVLIDGRLAYRALDISADSILAFGFVNRPDYAASAERVAQSASALSLARAALVPVPVVGGVYQPAEPFRSGVHVAPSLGLTLPILNAFHGERARAASSLAAARVAATRTRLQIQSDVALAFDSYRSARELADRYECGLLADAAGALDAARYAYERGATGLPDLLEAIRVYADTRSDYLTAVHDYWVSLFALEQAAGIDLEGATP
jgi:cobalt-zinc-cadmium efflux system outer membrane protein